MKTKKAPPIPKKYRKPRKVHFWGQEYTVTPAVCEAHHGNGELLLWFEPLNTRPDYYLIRVDSDFFAAPDSNGYDQIDAVIDLLIDEFSEKERERENLAEDLREQGIEPNGDNTDLAGNEERLGWPVLSLDSGYSWGEVCKLRG